MFPSHSGEFFAFASSVAHVFVSSARWEEGYMRMKPPNRQYKLLLSAAAHIHHTWNTRYAEEVLEIQKALAVDALAAAQV